MIKIILTFVFLVSSFAQADILKDFDSLGGNDALINRAKLLQPDKKVNIVQKRIVDRRWRHELSPTYSNIIGGDAYLSTQTVGFDYHLHINPQWAVGASYFSAFNKLSKEGDFLINNEDLVPDVDEPREGYDVFVNFHPIYGKFNFFNLGVVHFDMYALASLGNMTLKSGSTSSYSLGGGIGFWFSQHLTSRFEIRERFYEARRFDRSVDMDVTIASFSIGYLL